ncbi:MAG: thiolase family protein [Candidatus Nanopelagicales bacterium]|nr:thiolase family protein [Candidatus Nanopelagicales bacterium]MDP4824262.1 thiolase family protein [Candidatus Nanopelagicales bacterium]
MLDAVIVDARRTPIASAGHQLRDVTVEALAAAVLRPLAEHTLAWKLEIDDVILGVARDHGGNPARRAVLLAGLPPAVPGVTLDRQCGSGLDAIAFASAQVSTLGGCVIAGGAESASTGPPGRAAFAPAGWPDPDLGVAAEQLASTRNIGRDRQDAYARRSHDRALIAGQNGVFADEIVAVNDLSHDPRPRVLNAQRQARMPGAFVQGGSVTAGNSCGISDGAALVTITSTKTAAQLGLPGLAIRSIARTGIAPDQPTLGPVTAIRTALATANMSLVDVDRIEITEAFASQMCAVAQDLGLDDDDPRVCADGGAIALGHPWGASGAILITRLYSSLVRQRYGHFGMAACAVAGGQGIAMIVERINP